MPTKKVVCPHYWIIGDPTGPVSRGVCKLCGKVQMHPNTTELSWRDQQKAQQGLSFLTGEPFAQRAVRVKGFRNW